METIQSVCSSGHEKYLQQNYCSSPRDKDNVPLAKTTSIKKSTNEQQKNQENKKKKTNKGSNKNNKDGSLATLEAMTKAEDIPKFAWLD
jgi:hypothetical protein